MKKVVTKFNEEEIIQLDKDITSAIDNVPPQNPSDANQGNVGTMPNAEGGEKTPDSKETSLEKPEEAAIQQEVDSIAKGPQDAPTKAMLDVINMPKAEEQPHEVLESKIKEETKEDVEKEHPEWSEDQIAVYLKDKKDEKKQESKKSTKFYTILEDITINGKSYKKGTKIRIIEGEEVPGELDKDTTEVVNKPVSAQDPTRAQTSDTADTIPVETAVGDKSIPGSAIAEGLSPNFVIYEGEPKAVLNDMGEEIEMLYDANTGEIKTVKKSETQGMYESKIKINKEGKQMNEKVYTVKESVTIAQTDRDIILEEGDKFVIVEEDEKKEEPKEEKQEDEKKEEIKSTEMKEDKEDDEKMAALRTKKDDTKSEEKKDDEKKVESFITIKGKRYKVVEAEGDAKDQTEDEKLAKEAGMTMAEWEKSEADKKHDKKEESKEDDEEKKDDDKEDKKETDKQEKKTESVKQFKNKKVFVVKEDVKVDDVILEAGDKFIVLEAEQIDTTVNVQKPDPEADKYKDPVALKLDMPEVNDSPINTDKKVENY